MSLKAAEKEFDAAKHELLAEQTAWRTRLAEVERSVSSAQAKYEVVTAKLTEKTTQLAELTDETSHNEDKLRGIFEMMATVRKSLTDLQFDAKTRQETIAELDDQITVKRAELASGLADYKSACVQEIDLELESCRQEIGQLEQLRDGLITTVASRRAELTSLQQRSDELTIEITDRHLEVNAKLNQVEQTLVTTLAELDKRTGELKKATYERDQALSAASKAELTHKQFLEYESRARKVLDAKDRELQDRQAELQTSEQMLANRRSFLNEL